MSWILKLLTATDDKIKLKNQINRSACRKPPHVRKKNTFSTFVIAVMTFSCAPAPKAAAAQLKPDKNLISSS